MIDLWLLSFEKRTGVILFTNLNRASESIIVPDPFLGWMGVLGLQVFVKLVVTTKNGRRRRVLAAIPFFFSGPSNK